MVAADRPSVKGQTHAGAGVMRSAIGHGRPRHDTPATAGIARGQAPLVALVDRAVSRDYAAALPGSFFDDLAVYGRRCDSAGPDQAFYCATTAVAGIFLVLSAGAVSVLIALAIAGSLLSAVPPVRGVAASVRSQLPAIAIPSLLIVVPMYLVALSSSVCLSDSEIHYRPNLLFPMRTYGLSQVAEVQRQCLRGNGRWDPRLWVRMTGGSWFDLSYDHGAYLKSSQRILGLLHRARVNTAAPS